MGFFNRKGNKGAGTSVSAELAAVLPDDPRPWYLVPHRLKLNLVLLVPLLSGGAVGYDGSMMNGLQSLPQWRKFFGSPDGALLGAMNSVYPAGKVVALVLVTYLGDRFGRKFTMVIGCVTCIAFAIMQGFSRNFNMFIAARAILGFFTSFLSQPSPILIAELAYPTQRGKLTALYNTSFYLGGIIAAWMTYGMSGWTSNWAWRISSIVQGALPLIQLLGIYWLPESPRWLVARGRTQEARQVLIDFHAGGDRDSPLVKFEMAEIEGALTFEGDTVSQNSWFELIRTPANRKRTLIAVLVGWFAQWNGVGIISYYLTLVLNTIGITAAREQTLINGLLQISNWLAAIFVGALMIDRIGRRTLFLASTAGMCVSYIIWTALTATFVESHNAEMGKAVVAFIFIFFFFYAIAWAPLLQAYIVEIYPYTLRGRGVSTMYISTFVGLVVGNQVNPIAMKAIGWKYYIFFCCLLAVLFVVIWWLFPETKGHSLEEIREVFEGKASPKVVDPEDARDGTFVGYNKA
ncbi:general substrate transporter [Lophiostoma macrostomum CBS 122681]|uniref:General substrate transporter n=1 Tax=Lophiostoma macrostomum CBS 122681 TaxID=1314788 RepID=A0A6A6TIZ6_9PLEO|nr:general substrate transporter [Lophiostoma macrostomum CBS 122681]